MVSLTAAAQSPEAERLSLDDSGFVRHWLIAGPYPNPRAEPEPRGFADDLLKHLGGEASVVPYAGMTDQGVFVADKAKLIAGMGSVNEWGFKETRTVPVAWRALHWEEESPIVSLDGRFNEIRDWLAAFAACWIVSPNDRQVQLRVGSDDGYKLYLNHELLGAFSTSRAAKEDQNVHPARLRSGLNLVLLKITDRIGGHAFCLRVTDIRGRPLPDLHVLLDHPQVRCAAACENLDEVDVVEGSGFARIRLGTEPRFPGAMRLSVSVGVADPQRCGLTVLATDGADRELLAETFEADLSPTKAFAFERQLAVSNAGDVKVGVRVRDGTNGTVLAHLTRAFPVLSLGLVQQQGRTLTRQLTERNARRQALEQELLAARGELSALRQEISEQHQTIERIYAQRREVLVRKAGTNGVSVDEAFTPAAGVRETVCLNGDGWEIVRAVSTGPHLIDDSHPPADGWEPGWVPMIGVEKYFRNRFFPAAGDGGHYRATKVMKCAPAGWTLSDARIGEGIWYRTTVDIPKRWHGKRLWFTTENAAHRARVYWNGSLCGVHTGWLGKVRIELPSAVPGKHELLVLVQRARSFGLKTPTTPQCFGLMGDVFITAVSDIAVTDTWVISSWRNADIEARVWLKSQCQEPTTITVGCQVVRRGRRRFRLGDRKVTVSSGPVCELRFRQSWSDPELWGIGGEYGNPVLQYLVVTVKQGEHVVDQHFTRFGFREFWKEGFHFYLNGRRVFIQGDNVGGRMSSRPYQILWQHVLRNTSNINTIRTHFEFQQEMIARVADEVGMLMIPQWYPVLHLKRPPDSKDAGADSSLSVEEFLTTDQHRENLRLYADWVKWLRNHPSVVVYSTDNEIFTQAWDTPEKLERNIRNDRLGAVYGRYVKELDPTRLVTRDGDEGTWGELGKWQEAPPADLANYHYPDFSTAKLVENWQSTYGKPVLFGETLYCSYGAWDGWVDAIPSQVAAKAERCRHVLSLYRDLEVSGWVGMGIGLDGFTELKPDGTGNPWAVTSGTRDRYKASGHVPELPHYPYFPITWPSLSGLGLKPEFHRFLSSYGHGSVNAYFAARPVCVANAVNAAYRESTWPMPELSTTRLPEALVTVTAGGKPLGHAWVIVTPTSGQACMIGGFRADAAGRAWLFLEEPGDYELRVDQTPSCKQVTLNESAFELKAGFGYLPRILMEVEK